MDGGDIVFYAGLAIFFLFVAFSGYVVISEHNSRARRREQLKANRKQLNRTTRKLQAK